MKNFIVTVIVLALLVVGGYYLLSTSPEPQSRDDQATTTDEQTQNENDVPEGWEQYDSEDFAFMFQHPDGADITENQDRGHVRVQVTGPDQEPNTEVTDGFSLWIMQESATTSLRDVADERLADETAREGMDVVEPVATTTVNGATGYSFANTTELGPTSHHVILPATGDAYFDVSYMISGDERATEYQNTVDQIIKSIE